MPRRIRIQFSGARYHVIDRGNFRQPVFATAGAAAAFERTLAEAVEPARIGCAVSGSGQRFARCLG